MSDLVASAYTMDILEKVKAALAEGKIVDISREELGRRFGAPREAIQAVTLILDDENYPIHYIQIPHESLPDKKRTLRVVSPKSYSFTYVMGNAVLITRVKP